jgi:hypothetical protein
MRVSFPAKKARGLLLAKLRSCTLSNLEIEYVTRQLCEIVTKPHTGILREIPEHIRILILLPGWVNQTLNNRKFKAYSDWFSTEKIEIQRHNTCHVLSIRKGCGNYYDSNCWSTIESNWIGCHLIRLDMVGWSRD